MGRIFTIIGKSATGKDTLFGKLIAELPLKTVVSYTTRPIREGERNGREYHFVTVQDLDALKEAGRVIEQRHYDTTQGRWYYFTANDGQIDLEAENYLLIMTLEGYGKLRKHFGEDRVVPLYIETSDIERLRRAVMREETQTVPRCAELCRRYLADDIDFSEENLIKYDIVKKYDNTDSRTCFSEMTTDIRKLLEDA